MNFQCNFNYLVKFYSTSPPILIFPMTAWDRKYVFQLQTHKTTLIVIICIDKAIPVGSLYYIRWNRWQNIVIADLYNIINAELYNCVNSFVNTRVLLINENTVILVCYWLISGRRYVTLLYATNVSKTDISVALSTFMRIYLCLFFLFYFE